MSKPTKRRAEEPLNGKGAIKANRVVTRSKSRRATVAIANVNKDFEYTNYVHKKAQKVVKNSAKKIAKTVENSSVKKIADKRCQDRSRSRPNILSKVNVDQLVIDKNNNATVKISGKQNQMNSIQRKNLSKVVLNTNSNIVDDGVVVSVDAAEEDEYPEPDEEMESDEVDTEDMVDSTVSTEVNAEPRGAKARKLLQDNPDLKQLFNELLDDRIKDVQRLSKKGNNQCIVDKSKNVVETTPTRKG